MVRREGGRVICKSAIIIYPVSVQWSPPGQPTTGPGVTCGVTTPQWAAGPPIPAAPPPRTSSGPSINIISRYHIHNAFIYCPTPPSRPASSLHNTKLIVLPATRMSLLAIMCQKPFRLDKFTFFFSGFARLFISCSLLSHKPAFEILGIPKVEH